MASAARRPATILRALLGVLAMAVHPTSTSEPQPRAKFPAPEADIGDTAGRYRALPSRKEGVFTKQQLSSERATATGRLLTAYREDGDIRARDRLIQLYMPLVETLARRHGRRGAELEDLVQVGSIGLLKAIDRFDPRKGEELTAYAVPTISGEIKRHLRDRGRGDPAALGQAGALSHRGEADAEPESEVDDRILLAGAFEALDDTERKVIYLRYIRERSRRDTAKELGMTDDRLRRSTQAALAKLRGELERGALPAPPREAPATLAPSEPPPEPDPAPAPVAEPSRDRNGGSHSGRLLVRMPQSLHDELASAAESDRVSLNQFITNALASAVGWNQPRSPEPPPSEPQPPRLLRAAIVTNIVVLALAGVAALLLLVAWQQGW